MKKKLFDAKTTGDIKLVDNLDYLKWASSEPNPEFMYDYVYDDLSFDLSKFGKRYAAKYFLEE